jgi:acetyltransferase-like isoleucine patch superfamily enzyme
MMTNNNEGMQSFRRFLAGETNVRVFSHPCAHPSGTTGFCPCDRPMLGRVWFYLRAGVLLWALRSPFSGLKIALLRRAGAKIGQRVHIATDVWIDPLFPQLLEIEDEVLIGVGVKIFLHEFTRNEFRAGRVTLRRGVLIGGSALIRSGVEIGEYASVAAGAVLGRDVPAGMLALGNPARIFSAPRKQEDGS